MNESSAFGERNHPALSTGIKAIGQFLMTGLIRSGDYKLQSGYIFEDRRTQLNGMHLMAFKWFCQTSEFERQIKYLEDPSLDI